MDAVLRALAIYVVLMVVLRLSGKRTLSELTTFNFVLLLIISESTQQALLGEDFSVTMAALVIITLVTIDRVADYLRFRFRPLDKLTDSEPVLLVYHGHPIREVMDREHVRIDEILEAARSTQGLGRLDQVRYAVLESSGGISIIPEPEQVSP